MRAMERTGRGGIPRHRWRKKGPQRFGGSEGSPFAKLSRGWLMRVELDIDGGSEKIWRW